MSSLQTKVYESTQKPGKSTSEVFWLRIMNDIIRPRFLKVKEKQENQCLQLDTYEKFYECHQYQSNRLEEDTIEMDFFSRKFDTCVQEGMKALYPLKRVEDICSNKIINIIKEQTSIRRQKQREERLDANASTSIANISNEKSLIEGSGSTETKIISSLDNKRQENYINGHKLTWQEKKSLQPSNILKS